MPSEVVLSLAIGGLRAEPVPREVMQSLTEANVRVSSTGPSGFDLKFAVSTRSPLLTSLLPNGYFDPPARVIISASLRGQQQVLMDGVITHHEMAPSDEAGKSMLSIKGEDLTRMMDLIDLTGLSFPAMPTEARIALMIAKYLPLYGIVPLVMPSVLLDVSNPLEEIPSQHGTDLAYIKYLAALVGYTFYLQPGPAPGRSVAYWGPLLRTAIGFLPEPPPIAIDFDHRSNVESLQFSFDGFAATQWLVYIQDTTSHLVLPIPVPTVNPISPPLASKLPLPLKIKNMSGMDKYSPIQAVAIGLAAAAAESNVVTGQGSLDVIRYGAILNARTMIEVHGAGITYDGQYFVDTVSHAIKPGSYKQTFTLSRNSLVAKAASPAGVAVQQLAGLGSGRPPTGTAPGSGTPLPPPGPALPSPLAPTSGGAGQPRLAGQRASLPASPR